MSWGAFLRLFATSLALAIGTSIITIALVDPLGISPFRVVSDEYLPQTNRRYIVPAIVRSGRYDSFIVGTSTVHSLDPRQANILLGGSFANLTLFASTPFEQAAVVKLLRKASAKIIIWGLDVDKWCEPSELPEYFPHVGAFPNWLYDDARWNDFIYLLNIGMLDLVRRKVSAIFWVHAGQSRADGYQRIWPAEYTYDLAKAQTALYGLSPPKSIPQRTPLAGTVRTLSELPNLKHLAIALQSLSFDTTAVVMFMPIHAASLPKANSADDILLADCKATVANLVHDRGDWVLDTAWPSTWTAKDRNFWDAAHYRDHLAANIIAGVALVLARSPLPTSHKILVLAHGR